MNTDFYPWPLAIAGLTGLAIALSAQWFERPSHAQGVYAQAPADLDCSNPRGTPEFNYCAQLNYEAADDELNAVYNQLKGQLDSIAQERLTDAELAWIDYRDAQCDFEVRDRVNTTGYGASLSDCLARITEQRTEELKRQMNMLL
jgi:uncharacterized protein YecT (DUF1311 family)